MDSSDMAGDLTRKGKFAEAIFLIAYCERLDGVLAKIRNYGGDSA